MRELLQGWGAHSSCSSAYLPNPRVHPVTGKVTYVNIVNVQDTGVELEAQRLGLLDWVGQLTVGLQQEANVPI